MTRTRAAVISIVLVGAVLAPLARRPVDDSFPLSTYPMFAVRRPRTFALSYAVGLTTAGARRTLVPADLGTREILQAAAIVDDAVQAGPRALAPLCTRIAARVAADPGRGDIATIRIVSGTHDAVAYLTGKTLGREFERWHCAVTR